MFLARKALPAANTKYDRFPWWLHDWPWYEILSFLNFVRNFVISVAVLDQGGPFIYNPYSSFMQRFGHRSHRSIFLEKQCRDGAENTKHCGEFLWPFCARAVLGCPPDWGVRSHITFCKEAPVLVRVVIFTYESNGEIAWNRGEAPGL